MSNAGQSPSVKRTRFTPQSSDPVLPLEGDMFYSDGTARAEGIWVYSGGDWQQSFGSNVITYTPAILGVTTNPTEGAGTAKIASYRVQDNQMTLWFALNQTVSGTAGSGAYIIELPAGYEFDGTLIDVAENSTAVSEGRFTPVGIAELNTSSASFANVQVLPWDDSSKTGLIIYGRATTGVRTLAGSGTADFNLSNTTVRFSLSATFPVVAI